MGGGGRRYRRCRRPYPAGWRRCWRTVPAFATPCFWRMPTAPPRWATRARLREIAEFAAAFVPSRERQLETTAQGRAFIEIARSAWPCDGLGTMIAACDGAIVYPVAVGLVSAAHDIRLDATLHAFLHALTSNWISAGSPADPARADRQPARAGATRAGGRRHRPCARCGPRSTISAAPPFVPISPACDMKPNIPVVQVMMVSGQR